MTVVVVAGMHRSGTSLVAGLLHSAGILLGDRLLPADPANPRGYFEDEEMFRFHAGLLARRGRSHLVSPGFSLVPDAAETEEARRLVETRSGRAAWGWKDPRTTLLLDFWADRIPDLCVVFAYRHPLEVLLSLVRRREPEMPGLLEGLDAWQAYNEAVLAFRRRPSRTLLVHARAVAADPSAFLRAAASRLGVPLDPGHAERPDEHGLRAAATVPEVLAACAPRCLEIYRELQGTADMPDPSDPASGDDSAPLPRPAARARLLAWLSAADPDATEAFYGASASSAYAAAQEYAWSLEKANDGLRRSLDEASAYARSLEEARTRAEGYARSLEDEVARLRRP